jgi:hypothetical protein
MQTSKIISRVRNAAIASRSNDAKNLITTLTGFYDEKKLKFGVIKIFSCTGVWFCL